MASAVTANPAKSSALSTVVHLQEALSKIGTTSMRHVSRNEPSQTKPHKMIQPRREYITPTDPFKCAARIKPISNKRATPTENKQLKPTNLVKKNIDPPESLLPNNLFEVVS